MAEQTISLPWQKTGKVEFSPDRRALGHFSLGAAFTLEMAPTRLGVSSESAAYVKRCRVHKSLAFPAWEINTESRIPFGSEPWLVRRWVLAGNQLRAVSDVRIGGPAAFDRLEADSMILCGEWSKISILPLSADLTCAGEWVHYTPENKPSPLYQNSIPWLSIRVESPDGTVVEISTGEDLWRTVKGAPEGGVPEFSVTADPGRLFISRVLGKWAAAQTFTQRSWRSKWHIAWTPPGFKEGTMAKNAEIWEMSSFDLPEMAQRTLGSGVCMMAVPVMKALRAKVRAAAGSQTAPIIRLKGWTPGFCETASHCGRSNDKKMLHWDLTEMMEFWLWANKQLVPVGGSLSLDLPGGSFADLPSLQGMTHPVV